MRFFLLVLVVVVMAGCKRTDQRSHTIVLLDTSASIDRAAFDRAISGIAGLPLDMKRGDRLTIVPIASNTELEARKGIIRFYVPNARQPYDQDLKNEQRRLISALARLHSSASKHPAKLTDILGGLVIAGQEFEVSPSEHQQVILLTDLLQDSEELNFSHDPRLESERSAKQLAKTVAKAWPINLKRAVIRVVPLYSRQGAALSRQRARAVQTFWREYLTANSSGVQIRLDWNLSLGSEAVIRRAPYLSSLSRESR